MKRKKIIFLVVIVLVLAPIIVFAQDTNNYNALLQFMKGNGAFEKWFMEVFTKLDTQINDRAIEASFVGRAIGGIGVMCYLSYLGWQMQSGERQWEVTPMIRPIIIGLILINWVGFTNLIKYPFEKIAEPSISIFNDIENQVNDVRVKRFEKQTQLIDALIKYKAQEKAKQDIIKKVDGESGVNWLDFSESLEKLFEPIHEFEMKLQFHLQKLVSEIIEAIALTILRVCTYLIFTIQKIWSYILIILGPIAVGISLIPGFENSFNNWVAKFININLYTFISYTIINIGQQLIVSGYLMEIERYDQLIKDGAIINYNVVLTYTSNNGFIYTILFTVVAYIVTGIALLMTPTIADSIVSAGGAGAMSKAKAAATKAIKLATTKI